MRKKILYLFTALTFLLNISNKPIFAGPFGDEMARCLVTSTNNRDRNKLLKWIFRVYGDHPEVSFMVDISEREKKEIDKDVADIFTRLLSKDCIDETKKAKKYEGNDALITAFSILGEVAANEIIDHPNVERSTKKFVDFIDSEKLDYFNK